MRTVTSEEIDMVATQSPSLLRCLDRAALLGAVLET